MLSGTSSVVVLIVSNLSSLDAIEKSISSLELSEEQKGNMSSFLDDKRSIIRFGDLKEHDFERITELGSGNGGVVLKVKHTPSGIIMARKVGNLHGIYILFPIIILISP